MKITPKNFAIASKEILKIFCLQSFAYLSKIVRYSLLLGIASHQACLFTSSSTMNIKDQKTTMLPKTETGGWKTVKHDQTCVKQKISSRSHKQNKAFRQVIIWLPIRKQIACWLVSNSGYHCGMKTSKRNNRFWNVVFVICRSPPSLRPCVEVNNNALFSTSHIWKLETVSPIFSELTTGYPFQEREFGVTIESDEDIDTGFSCLLEENGSGNCTSCLIIHMRISP